MKASEWHAHVVGSCDWIDWDRTTDGFRYGDPGIDVTGISVCWTVTEESLRTARESGDNLFITHEPTFLSPRGPHDAFDPEDPQCRIQAERLERHGMTLYRCHDFWDIFPGRGVLDSWARHFGWKDGLVQVGPYMRIAGIEPVRFGLFAAEVARRVAELGQDWVEVVGSDEAEIRSVGIGTGAIVDLRTLHREGAAAAIVTERTYWNEISWARDIGFPVILVGHCTSEEPGMRSLANYLRERFPEVPVHYIPHPHPGRIVRPAG